MLGPTVPEHANQGGDLGFMHRRSRPRPITSTDGESQKPPRLGVAAWELALSIASKPCRFECGPDRSLSETPRQKSGQPFSASHAGPQPLKRCGLGGAVRWHRHGSLPWQGP